MNEIINQYIERRTAREKFYSDLAQVKSVDDSTRQATVNILTSDLEISSRCQATISLTAGLYIKPAVDSYVVVNWINKNQCFIALYSEVDQVIAIQTEWIFNDGSNEGLVIAPELKTQLDKTNNLITALTNIISGAPISEPGNGAPSAFQAALSAALTGQTLGNYSNIQNTDVKH